MFAYTFSPSTSTNQTVVEKISSSKQSSPSATELNRQTICTDVLEVGCVDNIDHLDQTEMNNMQTEAYGESISILHKKDFNHLCEGLLNGSCDIENSLANETSASYTNVGNKKMQ